MFHRGEQTQKLSDLLILYLNNVYTVIVATEVDLALVKPFLKSQ